MAKIVLTVHGMTNEKPGYSRSWYNCLNLPSGWGQGEFYWDTYNDEKWNGLSQLLKVLVKPFFDSLYIKAEMYSDVPKYSLGQVKKEAINSLANILEKKIKSGDEIILLAHSLGSVLAYEALCETQKRIGNKLDSVKLITFGSPLTSGFERWFLNVSNYKIYPKDWLNASGKKDIVGGRDLKFSSFDGKKFGIQVWFDVTHSEFEYLAELNKNEKFNNLFS